MPSAALAAITHALRRQQAQGTPSGTPLLYPVLSFAGGLNTKSSLLFFDRQARYALKPDHLTLSTNLLRTASGGLVTRPGRRTLGSALAPPVGDSQVRDLFELRRSNGTNHLLAHAGNTVYEWDGSSWTSLGTLATANTRIHWCQYQDTAIGFDGTNTPIRYDGTTFTTLGGSPPTTAAICASFRNRVFALTGYTLSWSALGNINDWTTANDAGSMPVPFIRGGGGTGLFPFWDRLLIFGQTDVAQLVGSSPAIWQVLPINTQYGHQGSPAAVIAAGNDVYFCSAKGIHSLSSTLARSETGDTAWDYESAPIEPTWLDLTPSNLANVVAVHDVERNLLIFVGNRNGATNAEAFVGDYYHLDEFGKPTWGLYSAWPFSAATESYRLNSGVPRLVMGDYDGQIYQQHPDELQDNGINIPVQAQYVTDLGVPGWQKTFRRLVLYARATTGSLISNTSYDFGERVLTQTTSLAQTTGDQIGVDFTLGTSALGTQTFVPHEIGIPGHGRIMVLNLNFTANARLHLGGFIIYAGLRRMLTGRV